MTVPTYFQQLDTELAEMSIPERNAYLDRFYAVHAETQDQLPLWTDQDQADRDIELAEYQAMIDQAEFDAEWEMDRELAAYEAYLGL